MPSGTARHVGEQEACVPSLPAWCWHQVLPGETVLSLWGLAHDLAAHPLASAPGQHPWVAPESQQSSTGVILSWRLPGGPPVDVAVGLLCLPCGGRGVPGQARCVTARGPGPGKASCVAGLPSQKPKEQQRSVLRPAVLQAPPPKALPQSSKQPRAHTHTHCASTSALPCRATLALLGALGGK